MCSSSGRRTAPVRRPATTCRSRLGPSQHAVAGADPVAQGKAHHCAAVDTAAGAGVDVLDGGLAVFQMSVLEQAQQFAVIAGVDFPVAQQRHALLEAERGHAELGQLFFQSGRQAVQFQSA